MLCLWFRLLGKLSLLKQIFYGPKIDGTIHFSYPLKLTKNILLTLSLRIIQTILNY